MYHNPSDYMYFCTLHLYTKIYAYIGVFWLVFVLILHHCSPWRGESPMTSRELNKTAKCKLKII